MLLLYLFLGLLGHLVLHAKRCVFIFFIFYFYFFTTHTKRPPTIVTFVGYGVAGYMPRPDVKRMSHEELVVLACGFVAIYVFFWVCSYGLAELSVGERAWCGRWEVRANGREEEVVEAELVGALDGTASCLDLGLDDHDDRAEMVEVCVDVAVE